MKKPQTIAARERGFELAESVGLPVDRWPKNGSEAAKADKALEEALEQMSLADKEKIAFELHGIDTFGDRQNEDPSIVDAKLMELDSEISLIKEKPAYEVAKIINQSFVESRHFRLMFLRAERFDVKKAADLLVFHLERKLELFGDGEVLARDVRLTDLSRDDLDCLKRGYIQVSPSKDVVGRTILICIAKLKKYKHVNNLIRSLWYVQMAVLQDEEAQRKGMVILIQNYGNRTEPLSNMKSVRDYQHGVPKRACAWHFCFSNPLLWPVLAGARLFLLGTNQDRLRAHFGQPKDVAFQLQTFGIPKESCPTECPDVEWHHQWLQLRQKQEEQGGKSSVVLIPRRFDVLFGKSKRAREHTGTVRCQYLVEMMRDHYEKASSQEKTAVADRIIAAIHDSQGRFLKCDERGLWVEVDHTVAREKVSHFYRHLRSKAREEGGESSAVKRPQVATPTPYQSKRIDLTPRLS